MAAIPHLRGEGEGLEMVVGAPLGRERVREDCPGSGGYGETLAE